MFRVNFYHTVLRKHPTTGVVEPLQNVQANSIKKITAGGTEESSSSPIYANREGATAGNSYSNVNGIINFWLDPGDYNVYITDTTVTPKRVVDSVVGVSAISAAPGGVLLSQLVAAVQQALVPAGTIVATGRSTMPTAWLLCDGATYNNADYPTLYAAIGTNYGTGGGATFKVPDLRGRVPTGVDGGIGRISATENFIGQSAGEDVHLLTEGEMPTHHHDLYPYAGVRVLTTTSDRFVVGYGVAATGSPAKFVFALSDPSSTGIFASIDPVPDGGGLEHNNMPPYQIVNFMIKT